MVPANKDDLSPGDVVGHRYRIDAVLGRGGFGAVYEATHVHTGGRVALKVLHVSATARRTDTKRFRRESSLLKTLRHPNVVRLLDFGETTRGVPFLAIELLRGMSLDEALEQQGPMSERRVGEITRDTLAGLDAAHRMGIIHRDIKPANVFLCNGDGGPGPTKLLDFGIAKALDAGVMASNTELTHDGQLVGTPFYMAPEQVRGQSVGPATDLYALGLVMAEMLAGERIVTGESILAVYMAHVSEVPLEIPESVSASPWGLVIAKATEKDLGKRYRTAREMAMDVASVSARYFGKNAPAHAATPDRSQATTVQFERATPTPEAGSLGKVERATAEAAAPDSMQTAESDGAQSRPRVARFGTVVMNDGGDDPTVPGQRAPRLALPPSAPVAPPATVLGLGPAAAPPSTPGLASSGPAAGIPDFAGQPPPPSSVPDPRQSAPSSGLPGFAPPRESGVPSGAPGYPHYGAPPPASWNAGSPIGAPPPAPGWSPHAGLVPPPPSMPRTPNRLWLWLVLVGIAIAAACLALVLLGSKGLR